MNNKYNLDNIYNNLDIVDTCDKSDNTDINDTIYNINNIVKTEYFLFYKKINYTDKIIKNYYFSNFLIIYKFYDIDHKVVRKKTVVYKKNNNIFSIEKYCLNGDLRK